MRRPATAPVLWLRSAGELRDHSVRHALLYPAYEYTALVYSRPQAGDGLDPFETAVLGACQAGVASIAEQAEILDLDAGFVAHLQERLRDQRLIDGGGRVISDRQRLVPPTVQEAVRLYWDPFGGSLWPRYVRSDQQRCRVPARRGESGLVLDAGTDGDSYEIRAYRVAPPKDVRAAEVAADEAIDAIRAWARDLRRFHGLRPKATLHDPSASVASNGDLVFLACPASRSGGKRQVQDPFGSALWPPFTRRLHDLAATRPGLAAWMGEVRTAMGEPNPVGSSASVLLERVEELRMRSRAAKAPATETAQLAVDLQALAHALVDHLLDGRPNPTAPSAEDHLMRVATMFGFDLGPEAGGRLRRAVLDPAADHGLLDHTAQLLRRFRPDEPGPLHRVAGVCSDLFTLAAGLGAQGRRAADVKAAIQIVDGLAAGLVASDDHRPQPQDRTAGGKAQPRESSTSTSLDTETIAPGEHRPGPPAGS